MRFIVDGKTYSMSMDEIAAAARIYHHLSLQTETKKQLADNLWERAKLPKTGFPSKESANYHALDTIAQKRFQRSIEELFSSEVLDAIASKFACLKQSYGGSVADDDLWKMALCAFQVFLDSHEGRSIQYQDC